MPVVDPGALHVACRSQLNALAALRRSKVPHAIDIIMIGQYLRQRLTVARHNVDHSCWQISSLEDLVAIRRAQRRCLGWNNDQRIAHRDGRRDKRDEAEQRILIWTGDSHHAFVLVRPGRVAEQARNSRLHFCGSIAISSPGLLHNAMSKLVLPRGEILGDVVENLCPVMRCAACPTCSSMRSLYRVTNILAIVLTHLTYNAPLWIIDIPAVPRVWARLLPPDKQLGRAIDGRHRHYMSIRAIHSPILLLLAMLL